VYHNRLAEVWLHLARTSPSPAVTACHQPIGRSLTERKCYGTAS
jgi:hypothetical protein